MSCGFCDAMRDAFQLRSRLFPYISTAAAESSREMVPLLRSMFVDFGEHEMAYATPHQYMLRRDLLIALIIEPGMGSGAWGLGTSGSRRVMVGEMRVVRNWKAASGSRPVPGVCLRVHRPRSCVCVRWRANPDAPRHDADGERADLRAGRAVLPGGDGRRFVRELAEDDGVSLEHERGVSASTPLVAEWSRERDADGVVIVPAASRWAPPSATLPVS